MHKLRVLKRARPIPAKANLHSQTNGRRFDVDRAALGDVLYRLSLVSPTDYRAADKFLRYRYKQLWPHETDILELREAQGVLRLARRQ